ncbi:endonuclease/exonuclease/phosphatase family protein [Octadecabacter sp. CECT 8868]|uniref:endonuclease/exonuclease/phosphatase family protein n=1 Tax=Octadecabacter algicola TaxID=2909342 RepID=UPI001F261B35|nr:endonuclease/exonuclease/phosphatase family protein [Octadecabacter algicola]MCF2903510.1 endonuclease/exonuclease/phosphatase family protein [Octadecabacter algicola]
MWQLIGRSLVICAGIVFAMSFAGDIHGLGDSLAVFRPVILLGSLGVCVLVWRWRVAQALVVSVCLVALWYGAGLVPSGDPALQPDISIYQKNMLFLPSDRTELIADIRESGADVVTLQEVSHANTPMLGALRDDYPYQLLCNAHEVGVVAVLSRTPFTQETCANQPGFGVVSTEVSGVLVQVASVHLFWPWPRSQQQQVTAWLDEMVLDPKQATVIGGDFNMVASGRSMAWIEDATETQRVGPWVRTYDFFGYPLGIDHVLATGGQGALTVRPQLGSDHFGLLAGIELP